jgi:hypothetical protein
MNLKYKLTVTYFAYNQRARYQDQLARKRHEDQLAQQVVIFQISCKQSIRF